MLALRRFSCLFCCSVAQLCPILCGPVDCSHSRPPCPSPSPAVALSIESVMPSNHLILCHPLSFCFQSFPTSESFLLTNHDTMVLSNNYIIPIVNDAHHLSQSGFTVSPAQPLSHARLCDPVDCSMAGLPVHHQLLEFTQTHVH